MPRATPLAGGGKAVERIERYLAWCDAHLFGQQRSQHDRGGLDGLEDLLQLAELLSGDGPARCGELGALLLARRCAAHGKGLGDFVQREHQGDGVMHHADLALDQVARVPGGDHCVSNQHLMQPQPPTLQGKTPRY